MKYIIAIMILTISCHNGFSQVFYSDYSNYLKVQYYKHMHKKIANTHSIDDDLSKLRTLFIDVKVGTNIDMLKADTIYLLNYAGQLGSYNKALIWNNKHSCQYEYNFRRQGTTISKNLTEQTDASNSLDSLNSDLKRLVKTADATKYNTYTKSHLRDLDGDGIRITVAIRYFKHWKFISSDVFGEE